MREEGGNYTNYLSERFVLFRERLLQIRNPVHANVLRQFEARPSSFALVATPHQCRKIRESTATLHASFFSRLLHNS